jgi:hypothetical protein
VPIVPTDVDAEEFIDRGFVRLRGAFPSSLAERCVTALWEATGRRRDDPSTWDAPVVRLGYRDDSLFVEAVTTPALHAAFDLLAGRAGRWPRPNVGTFPVRFPHSDDPGDTGWHIDGVFRPEGVHETDVMRWRIKRAPLDPDRRDGQQSPVERAIRLERRGDVVAAQPTFEDRLLRPTAAEIGRNLDPFHVEQVEGP